MTSLQAGGGAKSSKCFRLFSEKMFQNGIPGSGWEGVSQSCGERKEAARNLMQKYE